MKRDEIMEKLRKAEFIGGFKHNVLLEKKLLEKAEKELKTEFIPEMYDKTMEKLYDEKYYAMSDDEAENFEMQRDLNLKLMRD